MPKIKKKEDGTIIVVDQFSGKRYPPGEEAYIIATCGDHADEDKKSSSGSKS